MLKIKNKKLEFYFSSKVGGKKRSYLPGPQLLLNISPDFTAKIKIQFLSFHFFIRYDQKK